MIALYIFLGLIGLIAVALYLPLRIVLHYDGELGFQYKLSYAGFCLLDSSKEKPEAEEAPKPAPVEEKKEKKQKKGGRSTAATLLNFLGLGDIASIANARKALGDKGLCQMLSDIGKAVKELLLTTGRLIGRARFRRFDLQILIGDADAGDAALLYGRACALLYPILDSLEPVRKCKKRRIDLRCDFLREESLIYFDGQLQYRPWHFIRFLGGLIWNYIKRSVKRS